MRKGITYLYSKGVRWDWQNKYMIHTTLTYKQKSIIQLLYQYRFLTRLQIQTFLTHKDKKTIQLWLNLLTQNDYLKSKPSHHHLSAIFYLSTKGVNYLKTVEKISKQNLRYLYYEDNRKASFIEHSVALADIALDLRCKSTELSSWQIFTRSTFFRLPVYELVKETATDLYLINQQLNLSSHYLLNYLEVEPYYKLRKKVAKYFELCDSIEWSELSDDEFPTVLFICSSEKVESYLIKLVKRMYRERDEPEIKIKILIRGTKIINS